MVICYTAINNENRFDRGKQRILGHRGKDLAQPMARDDFLKEDRKLRPEHSARVSLAKGGK